MWKKKWYSRTGYRWQNIIQCVRFACWLTEATDTHSEYVMHIADPPKQYLHEISSKLCLHYTACLAAYSPTIPRLTFSRSDKCATEMYRTVTPTDDIFIACTLVNEYQFQQTALVFRTFTEIADVCYCP